MDVYLHRGVVRRPALGEEAEGGVEPHHVVPLEAVLEGAHQQRLVRLGVPPRHRRQTLAHRGHQRQLATIDSNVNKSYLNELSSYKINYLAVICLLI